MWTLTKIKTGAQSDLIVQPLYRQVVAETGGAPPTVWWVNLYGNLVKLIVQMVKYLLTFCRSIFLQDLAV